MELNLIRATKVAGFSAILLVLCFVVGFSANATTTNGLNAEIYNVSGQVIPPTVLGNATPAGTYTVPQLLEDFDSNPRFGLGDTFVVKYTGYIVSETTQAISFYGPADDGLMVGSVHLWQTLELLLELRSGAFTGTIYFDTFPDRLDPAAECAANLRSMQRMEQLLDRIPVSELGRIRNNQDALAATQLIQNLVFGSDSA